VEKFCNVYLIHEMMLNNQTHIKKNIPYTERKKGTKTVLKNGKGGGSG
jgi:hypothetical protein